MPDSAKRDFPTLFFIRHGETAWNAEARLQGQQEIPLNTTGEKQAGDVGKLIASLPFIKDDMPYISSPMLRTCATMRRLRISAGLEPDRFTTDDRLKEISFGRWEGLTWKEVRQADPKGAAGREADKWGYVPPGGESYEMLLERVEPWLHSVTNSTVVVAHGGVARVLLVLAAGVSKLVAPKVDIWQGKILVLERGAFRWIG